jgi:hypothetical protein
MFPGKILAGLVGLQPKSFCELSSAEEKDSAAVEFREPS